MRKWPAYAELLSRSASARLTMHDIALILFAEVARLRQILAVFDFGEAHNA